MSKFKIDELVATKAVAERMDANQVFNRFIRLSLGRYVNADWGEVDETDKASFDENVKLGSGMLQGVYTEPKSKTVIWIVTEWDWKTTTILFPEEW
jgi:hypothetical protein